MAELNVISVIPYYLELRDTVSTALFHLEELRKAAAGVSRLDAVLESQSATRECLDHDDLKDKLCQQASTFHFLEAFLAAWTRVSLLLFSAGSDEFTKRRGEVLQGPFDLSRQSPLADRELRDAWMHHDERLDAAIEKGLIVSGQRFVRSGEITEILKATCLRVIDVDRLVVHYHARDGALKSVELIKLDRALRALEASRAAAFGKLGMPPAATTP